MSDPAWDDGFEQGLRTSARLVCSMCHNNLPRKKNMFGFWLHDTGSRLEACKAESILQEISRLGKTP